MFHGNPKINNERMGCQFPFLVGLEKGAFIPILPSPSSFEPQGGKNGRGESLQAG
jgi:hypothetical protein